MLPEDQRTREVFEFYIDKCAFFKVECKIHILFFRYDADYDYALFPLSWAFYDISASFLMLFEMLNQCAFFVEMCILYTRNIMNVTKWGDWGR